MNFKKYSPAFMITLSVIMIIMGMISLIWAFETRTELDNSGIDSFDGLDSETKEKLQSKILNFLTEFIFGIIMAPWGSKILINTILNLKYKRVNHNRERKITYFQTQFGLGLLIIAVLISFSVQSMTDNRYEWMYLWGGLSVIGVIGLIIYREKMLNEIFEGSDQQLNEIDKKFTESKEENIEHHDESKKSSNLGLSIALGALCLSIGLAIGISLLTQGTTTNTQLDIFTLSTNATELNGIQMNNYQKLRDGATNQIILGSVIMIGSYVLGMIVMKVKIKVQ